MSDPKSSVTIPSRTYRPYEKATLDTPLLHMMMAPCLPMFQPLLTVLYKIRWFLGYPLSTRIFPKCIPAPTMLNLTVGELVLMTPLIIWFILGYEVSEVKPETDASGNFSAVCILYTFLTANKANSVFSFLFGIPFERMIWLHQLSSIFAIATGILHVRTAHRLDVSEDIMSYLWKDSINISGTIGLAAMMLLLLTSQFPQIRRAFFNLWLICHILLAIATLVGLALHEVGVVLLIAIWWALDLVIRYGIQSGCRYRVKAVIRRVGESPDSNEPAVEIKFKRPMSFNAGQFVQICLPKVSMWEFHPITISSAPHDEYMTMHIRQLGDWTERLLNLADSADGGEVDVWIEGPYGNLSVDLDDDYKYKMALLVSGGIGVTPMQSIGRSLLHQHQTQGRKLKYFKYVWAVRNMKIVEDIKPLGGKDDYSTNSPLYRRQSAVIAAHKSEALTSDPSTMEMDDTAHSKASSKSKTKPPAVAQVDIYCTRGKPSDEESGGSAQNYNVHSGRPDLDAIFQELKETALGLGEHNIAVFGCGPAALMEDLRHMCRVHSQPVIGCSEGVFFDLHVEHFEY